MPFTILIVDDCSAVRRALRSFIDTNKDLRVCGEAIDGFDAVRQAHVLQPDLVILDLSMPGMNGLDTARALKSSRPSIRLLMFTSFKTPSLEEAALDAGCAAVVDKSEFPQLFASVQRLLPDPV